MPREEARGELDFFQGHIRTNRKASPELKFRRNWSEGWLVLRGRSVSSTAQLTPLEKVSRLLEEKEALSAEVADTLGYVELIHTLTMEPVGDELDGIAEAFDHAHRETSTRRHEQWHRSRPSQMGVCKRFSFEAQCAKAAGQGKSKVRGQRYG